MTSEADRDREILMRRAKKLARPLEKEIDHTLMIDIVTFKLAGERYAIESCYVEEVYPLEQVTSLPNTPSFVYGVINVRRKVVSVINLKKIFDLPESTSNNKEKAIILDNKRMQFAILVDEIEGVNKISENNLQHSLPTLTGIRSEYLKGLTNEPLIVLDGNKLLSSDYLLVKETI